jgi:2-polyprenyl-6-hydroxyphenyl methylase/3-demethylubiquinone-9 3-methyltransferase
MEVIEHVANVPVFLEACRDLTKPGCPLILSTPNRNFLSWLVVIVAAEYILRMIPVGMHAWTQFITPAELYTMAKPLGLVPVEKKGFVLDVFRWRWHIMDLDWVDYIVHFVRQ